MEEKKEGWKTKWQKMNERLDNLYNANKEQVDLLYQKAVDAAKNLLYALYFHNFANRYEKHLTKECIQDFKLQEIDPDEKEKLETMIKKCKAVIKYFQSESNPIHWALNSTDDYEKRRWGYGLYAVYWSCDQHYKYQPVVCKEYVHFYQAAANYAFFCACIYYDVKEEELKNIKICY